VIPHPRGQFLPWGPRPLGSPGGVLWLGSVGLPWSDGHAPPPGLTWLWEGSALSAAWVDRPKGIDRQKQDVALTGVCVGRGDEQRGLCTRARFRDQQTAGYGKDDDSALPCPRCPSPLVFPSADSEPSSRARLSDTTHLTTLSVLELVRANSKLETDRNHLLRILQTFSISVPWFIFFFPAPS